MYPRRVAKNTNVTKDIRLNNALITKTLKIPLYENFDLLGDDAGMQGNIIINDTTGSFCWHDGTSWQCITQATSIGPQGAQGAQGDMGIIGPRGVQGDTGPIGPIGPKGAQGTKGSQGSQGSIGPQGVQGPQGDPGSIGPQGDPGPQGDTGAQGPAGSSAAQTLAETLAFGNTTYNMLNPNGNAINGSVYKLDLDNTINSSITGTVITPNPVGASFDIITQNSSAGFGKSGTLNLRTAPGHETGDIIIEPGDSTSTFPTLKGDIFLGGTKVHIGPSNFTTTGIGFHLVTKQPTAPTHSGVGSLSAGSTDMAGRITGINTLSGIANFTITFVTPYTSTPLVFTQVDFTGTTTSQYNFTYIGSVNNASFTCIVATVGGNGTNLAVNYFIVDRVG